jgi:REP element-mobilizing transposase RayT
MSLPRAVIPRQMYMITRRCSERRFFLRPDRETNNAFIYCLAVAAEKYGVKVIFTATMSNHHHTGVLDVEGRLPDFLAHFHKLIAKHQNALRGRWENMWAAEQTSAVQLVATEDVFEKLVYALANPVAAHLVDKVHHWPGVSSLNATISDRPLEANRPRTFFREDGEMPASVCLPLHLPAELVGASRAEFVDRLKRRIADAESKAAAERQQSGRGILGRAAVRSQHWNDSPRSSEPRRQLDPRVACTNAWRRIEVLARNKVWLEAYRRARDAFLQGVAVGFPAGTFWLKRYAGVSCEPVAPS